MELKAYAIFDTKAQLFAQPFFMPNNAFAIRAIVGLAEDKSTTVGKYPGDFQLFCIGFFEDQIGLIQSTPHENLGLISSIVASVK